MNSFPKGNYYVAARGFNSFKSREFIATLPWRIYSHKI